MFKAFLYVMTLMSVMLFSSCEKNSTPAKEEFQTIAHEFESAWNKHDTQTLTNLWAEDGNLMNPWTDEYSGKKEIGQHFAQEHADTMKNSQIALSVQNVRFIDPETAFVDAEMTLTGMTFGGETVAPLRDHAVFLMVKRDGKWQILIARPY
jgi:uncharacterized protein (TIGR02246 family)